MRAARTMVKKRGNLNGIQCGVPMQRPYAKKIVVPPAALLRERHHELGLWQVHRPQLVPILLPWRKGPSSPKGCGEV